jgi:TM2 domain-containing membrane protein YozV
MGNQIEPSNPPKDPILAMILSVLLCGGAGQIYLGQVTKGIVIIVVSFFTCGIGWILGTIDAYLIAQRLKEGKSVDEWEFFWQNK